MQLRKLGHSPLKISTLGLGCMGMSEFYGPQSEEESIATIHRALDLGVNFLDTADVYGRGANEEWWAAPSGGGVNRQCWRRNSPTSGIPKAVSPELMAGPSTCARRAMPAPAALGH